MAFLVAVTKQGQLGNRLLQFGHLIGLSRRTGLPILNPAFGEYAELFDGTANSLLVQYPRGVSYRGSEFLQALLAEFAMWVPECAPPAVVGMLTRDAPLSELFWKPQPPKVLRLLFHQFVLQRAGALDPRQDPTAAREHLISLQGPEDVQIGDRTFLLFCAGKNAVYLDGWEFRDRDGFRSSAAAIKAFFTPVVEHRLPVERCMKRARSVGDIVIGVHVRRGDYASWENGRYLFSWEEYGRFMAEGAGSFPGRRVVFLVCSNEALPASLKERDDVVPGPGEAVQDLYALSRCDYLMGPPSTFTGWASFFGDVPLLQIKARDQSMRFDGVKPIYPF